MLNSGISTFKLEEIDHIGSFSAINLEYRHPMHYILQSFFAGALLCLPQVTLSSNATEEPSQLEFVVPTTVGNAYPFHPDERQAIRLAPRSGGISRGPAWIFVHLWWTNIEQAWLNDVQQPLKRRTFRDEIALPNYAPRVLWDIDPAFQGLRYTSRTMGWVCMSVLYNHLSVAKDDRPEWDVPAYDLHEVNDNKRIGSVTTRIDTEPDPGEVENRLSDISEPSQALDGESSRKRRKRKAQDSSITARGTDPNNNERVEIITFTLEGEMGIDRTLSVLNKGLEELIWPEDPDGLISQKYHEDDEIIVGPTSDGCEMVLVIRQVRVQQIDIRFYMLAQALVQIVRQSNLQRAGWSNSVTVANLVPKIFEPSSGPFLQVYLSKQGQGRS